ncbi:MAG: ribosomal protein S18-alanine N-acetyltransferase [Lachnospiraceae bacterium]|nr:ribosomal protein S18-alanine N-acetyltransferase [Lachnospiraceae bacterium]
METEIRPMSENDLEASAELEAMCFSTPWSLQAFKDSLDKPDIYLFRVAYLGDELVAQAGLIMSFDEADVVNVAVKPEYRKRGIASGLLNELMRAGSERGVKDYTLEVRAGNHGAIALYENLGFKTEGIRKDFYREPVEDALIMWKRS